MGAVNSNQIHPDEKMLTLASVHGAMKRCAELIEENGSVNYDVALQTLLKCNSIIKVVDSHFAGKLYSYFYVKIVK